MEFPAASGALFPVACSATTATNEGTLIIRATVSVSYVARIVFIFALLQSNDYFSLLFSKNDFLRRICFAHCARSYISPEGLTFRRAAFLK